MVMFWFLQMIRADCPLTGKMRMRAFFSRDDVGAV
jgi:hypothetical protein